MDTGEGSFRMLELEEAEMMKQTEESTKIFSVGEEVKIKDSRFRVIKITPKKLTLRLLPSI